MKNKYPLVSIVIPCFNSKDLVENCLKSILKAKYPNFEVIVVDDASTDGTYELLVRKFGNNSKVKIIKNAENSGPSKTRNHGIEVAKGKYIAFVETDMEVDPNWLRPLVEVLEADKRLGAVQSKALDINKRDRMHSMGVKYNPHTFWVISPGCGLDKDWVPDDLEMGIGSVGSIVRKSVIDKIGAFDEMLVHNVDDIDFGWRIWLTGHKIRAIPESITYHWTAKPLEIRTKVTPSLASEFQFHKGPRIIIKNYELKNVLYYLPWQALAYTLRVLKNLLQRNTKPLRAYLKAIFWNIVNIKDTLRERDRIQKLRRRSDQEMFRKIGLPGNFFQFYFGTVQRNLKWVQKIFGKIKKRAYPKSSCFVCGLRLEEVYDSTCTRVSPRFYYKVCPNCDVADLLPRPTSEELRIIYEKKEYFYGLSAPSTNPLVQWFLTRRVYKIPSGWVREKLKRGRILDVGCGNGEFLEELKKAGWDVWGSDISSLAVKNTAKKIGKEKVKQGNFLKQTYGQKFDFISFWHVLEHVQEPLSYLTKAKKLLKRKGRLIGEVPNFDSPLLHLFKSDYSWIMVPVHVTYFSKGSLIRTLQKAEFKNIEIHTPPRALLNLSLSIDKVLARKNISPVLRKAVLLLSIPLSVVTGVLLSVLGRGEVVRFIALR